MSAETLNCLSVLWFSAAGICTGLSIFFFVRFKVPDIIGNLTGKNARKSMEQMGKAYERPVGRVYKSDNRKYEKPMAAMSDTVLLMDENATEWIGDGKKTEP